MRSKATCALAAVLFLGACAIGTNNGRNGDGGTGDAPGTAKDASIHDAAHHDAAHDAPVAHDAAVPHDAPGPVADADTEGNACVTNDQCGGGACCYFFQCEPGIGLGSAVGDLCIPDN